MTLTTSSFTAVIMARNNSGKIPGAALGWAVPSETYTVVPDRSSWTQTGNSSLADWSKGTGRSACAVAGKATAGSAKLGGANDAPYVGESRMTSRNPCFALIDRGGREPTPLSLTEGRSVKVSAHEQPRRAAGYHRARAGPRT